MVPIQGHFNFDYSGQDIIYGRGRISEIELHLEKQQLDNALVVCGSNVGANDDLMNSLQSGLGERLSGVFDETTPTKSIETVYDGIEAMEETEADVLVGVGGGSSLDIARQMSVFRADGRSLETFQKMVHEEEFEPPTPTQTLTSLIVVPTTFAGADISSRSVVEILPAKESPTNQAITGGGSIDPIAMFYDPDLFETTPMSALAGSAMNGFNKGIERIYSNESTPITDATAMRGLRMMREGLPTLLDDAAAMERAVIGIILVQFVRRLSVIHAFAHGYTRRYSVQQGEIHGILAPHILRYIFENTDARREVLAEGLGIDPAPLSNREVAEAIISEVVEIRDSLDLPTRLRDIDALSDGDFSETAEYILTDRVLSQGPDGLDPTVEEIEAVLRDAW